MPARSFRIMRSAVSALSAAVSTWKSESVMFPVRSASLWQTWQYRTTTSVSVAAGQTGGVGRRVAGGRRRRRRGRRA